MGTPMLLEGSGPLAVRRDEGTGRPLIDALPYADPLDTASRATAEALVQEEVRSPNPPPPPPRAAAPGLPPSWAWAGEGQGGGVEDTPPPPRRAPA